MTGRILPPNLASLFLEAGERWGDHPAFSTRREDGTFRSVSYRELRERAVALATALQELDGGKGGVAAGDHVAILSDNRLEWILADAAVQLCGAADVPRAADVTGEEIAYILGHADVGIAFVENDEVLAKVVAVRDRLPTLRHLILMEGEAGSSGHHAVNVIRLRDLEIRGEELRFLGDRSVERRVAGISPGDLYTIIYTSGTTGIPKGVELSHASIVSQIRNLPFALSPRDRALSILPVWHVYERVFEMLSVSSGLHTYYSSLRHLGEDLKAVRPTIMASAPRLWEGLHRRILSTVEKAPAVRRILFHAARISSHGVRRAEAFFGGRQVDPRGRRNPCSSRCVTPRAGSCS
jgi:long-chain acyl-CoA synthetase